MSDLIIGIVSLAAGIILIVVGIKGIKLQKQPERKVNPDGDTRDEFIEKHSQTKHIAEICWFFGIYPEELRDELKTLLNESEGNWDD